MRSTKIILMLLSGYSLISCAIDTPSKDSEQPSNASSNQSKFYSGKIGAGLFSLGFMLKVLTDKITFIEGTSIKRYLQTLAGTSATVGAGLVSYSLLKKALRKDKKEKVIEIHAGDLPPYTTNKYMIGSVASGLLAFVVAKSTWNTLNQN